jgi:3-oxoacyl-[acyl-carrier protein] reductase
VAAIRAAGGKAHGVAADVSRADDVVRLVETAGQTMGHLDMLVVNAGGPKPGSFDELTDADWERGFQLTVMSVVRVIRQALPRFPDTGGRIVVMTSSSVREPLDYLTLSNVFRPGVAALVKDLALALASRRILVNAVAPGRFDTDRVRENDRVRAARNGLTVEEEQRRTQSRIPLGRYGDPMELARVVRFLLSEENTYVTGQTWLVDGGLVRAL